MHTSPSTLDGTQTRIASSALGTRLVLPPDAIVEDFGLLDQYKVITDKVWEDIWISELESFLIDTKEFQRLHWVLQLGTSIFVYPDASHTRFDHALGTLEATQRIVVACNENHTRYEKAIMIGPYARLLARLGGVLHDLAQMPYAHTLDSEGEGHLFETEWKNSQLRRDLLGRDGFVEARLYEFFNYKFSDHDPEEVAHLVENLVVDLDWVLARSHEKPAPPLPADKKYLSYVRDIIGNTICADLLDYVQRDLLSVGFRDRVSLRPLQFFVVKDVKGIPKLALALFKPKDPDKMREDVVFEAIEFLRKRYSLGERVYFHHAKMAASAMVIKAIDCAGLRCEEVWKYGDHALLLYLESLAGQPGEKGTAGSIAKALLQRRLFKLAYQFLHKEERFLGDPVQVAKKSYAEGAGAREQQKWLENTLAETLGVSSDSLAVYAPDPGMNLKTFSALVWPRATEELSALKDLPDAHAESEELMKKHQRLWRLAVFVRRELYYSVGFRERVERLCTALLDGPRIDSQIVSEVYVESHKEEFGSQGFTWPNRDRIMTIVKQAITGKERGGFTIPNIKAVLAELKEK